jgi:lipoate-protein ligase B
LGTRFTLLRPGTVEYQRAWDLQRRIADNVRAGADPVLILLEHPPTYTLGARGDARHLVDGEAALRARGADVVRSDRGGDVTFHGPGQIVGYPIVDLRRLGIGPSVYVRSLESMLMAALARFGIDAARFDGRPGGWCGREKIAAIGVRVSRGVTTHGFALNVSTDLAWFDGVVACGYADTGVTSMQRMTGVAPEISTVEEALAVEFGATFGVEKSVAAEAVTLGG